MSEINEKLDKWAQQLLDTSKRNNLVNFKDRKSSTVEIVYPDASDAFEMIQNGEVIEIYDPKIAQEEYEADDEVEDNRDEKRISKQQYIDKYSPRIHKKKQVLLYSIGKDPLLSLRNIDKKARDYIEETGVNVAYVAFGFIHWTESDSSELVFNAPVLLIPVQLIRESAVSPYNLTALEDEVVVNPTFAYKLNAEYGIVLPEYNDEGINGYLSLVEKLIHHLKWSITNEAKIGLFSFLKINMYRDLKDNQDKILSNNNIKAILGSPDIDEDAFTEPVEGSVKNPLIDLHNVVDADSSQIDAIIMAKSGKSFVLQGPPGTGKSQTITNIIAECLYQGKQVLFVSEKLAALNVVYDKLKQAGLSEFCLELHSHKAKKKNVIQDLWNTLTLNPVNVTSNSDADITKKEHALKKLDEYAEQLHEVKPTIEMSLFDLFNRYYALRDIPDIEYDIPDLETLGQDELSEITTLLDEYAAYSQTIGYDYHNNTWYGFSNRDTSYNKQQQFKQDLNNAEDYLDSAEIISEEISKKYNCSELSIQGLYKWKEFFTLACDIKYTSPALYKKNILKKIINIAETLHEISNAIVSSERKLHGYNDSVYSLPGEEWHQILVESFSGVFSRLFNDQYKNIIISLQKCRTDGRKPSYSEAVDALDTLSIYQANLSKFNDIEEPIASYFGPEYTGYSSDWDEVEDEVRRLQVFLNDEFDLGSIVNMSSEQFQAAKNAFKRLYDRCFELSDSKAEAFEKVCSDFDSSIIDLTNIGISEAKNRLSTYIEQFDQLMNWQRFDDLLDKLNNYKLVSYVDQTIKENISSDKITNTFRKRFFFQWINTTIGLDKTLAGFDRVLQDKAVKDFSDTDVKSFEINKAKIKSKLSHKRPSTNYLAQGSETSILKRENEKKRRQKSIRKLLSEISGLVKLIKPCFLMSPLSVSTFLDSDTIHFDVIVFDEASQIFPQDAVGSIYRGNQLIVVGDSKQMPPSNFFNSVINDDYENPDDEEYDDINDFDSILELCASTMPEQRLQWHYRSRYEQLIAYSNNNFYGGSLITFPSSEKDRNGIGVDYYHVSGIFDRKSHTNVAEAQYIVELVYKNIEEYPNRSLGVVAFSVAQQDLIERLLYAKRQEKPEYEYFFKDDVKEPFFIKNLETVQGDERDTIIFSIAYGFDNQGHFYHNFGPINHIGGERRLNVAVTRAKINVQVVASIHYNDIDLTKTSADGSRLLREYLDFAENGEVALKRSVNVNGEDQFDSDFEMDVCDFIRSKGYTVDTQVGCSGYRIDLAVRRPDSSDYSLAIECDGATYHSSKNARDRDRLRQQILENMGWHFYRIWSTDWFRNTVAEQHTLIEAIEESFSHIAAVKEENSKKKDDLTYEEFDSNGFNFAEYKIADITQLSRTRWKSYEELIKSVLKVEAPMSEDMMLKRTVWYFGREKVTSYVWGEYYACKPYLASYGITLRNGFLNLKENTSIRFRSGKSYVRDIKDIYPAELAAGILTILKQNVSVDKEGLYKVMAEQCGYKRLTDNMIAYFEGALGVVKDRVKEEGTNITYIGKA